MRTVSNCPPVYLYELQQLKKSRKCFWNKEGRRIGTKDCCETVVFLNIKIIIRILLVKVIVTIIVENCASRLGRISGSVMQMVHVRQD